MRTQTVRKAVHILHLEDSDADQLFLREALVSGGLPCEIKAVKSGQSFEAALAAGEFDLIISDYSLPSFDGMSALSIARRVSPETPFMFYSGTIGEELAVDSLRGGAVDYVLKQRPHRLLPAIQRALKDSEEHKRLRQAEAKVREQAALLDKASDAIILCDLETRILFWNKGAERIYGWNSSEVQGKELSQLLFRGNPPPEIEKAIRSLDTRGEWLGELQEFTKEGREVTVYGRATMIRDDAGVPRSLLIINTDITEHKQLEEQFLRAQRLESLGVLVSGIAHDLNNALSPILMATGILRRQVQSEQAVPLINLVEGSARRGADMVKQVLAFARGADTRKTSIHVGRLVKEMGKIICEVFPKNVKCRVNAPDETWPVSGVATQLHQVLMNLCVNARDALPQGGTLTLSTQNTRLGPQDLQEHPEAAPGDYVAVTVADTGIGITEEQLSKLFQPFFTTKAPGKGTGLGLSTSRNIIKSHGGFMKVESQFGCGSQFTFFVPAVTTAENKETAAGRPALPTGAGQHILVVDDEETVLAITRATLENFGYTVSTASSGPESVATFADHRNDIALVLLDLAMPFMDGIATSVALRKIKPAVPIIITSGLAEQRDEDTDRRIKAASFLPKPFTAETLLAHVHTVLRGAV